MTGVMPSACSRCAAPNPAIPVPRTTILGIAVLPGFSACYLFNEFSKALALNSPCVLGQSTPGSLNLIHRKRFVTFNLRAGKAPEIAARLKGLPPLHDPAQSQIQRQHGMPTQATPGFGSVQLEKVRFFRVQ